MTLALNRPCQNTHVSVYCILKLLPSDVACAVKSIQGLDGG